MEGGTFFQKDSVKYNEKSANIKTRMLWKVKFMVNSSLTKTPGYNQIKTCKLFFRTLYRRNKEKLLLTKNVHVF